jgi:FkbM family methyltransferase
MAAFRRVRSRDVNLEAAVAATKTELTFYLFNESALNTFDRQLAMQRASRHRLIREVKITTVPLKKLLDEYLPTKAPIDVLTVDVEGFDYDVLRSNDWDRYRPEYIIAECLGAASIEEANAQTASRFLMDQGYTMIAKTMNSAIFRNGRPEPITAGVLT